MELGHSVRGFHAIHCILEKGTLLPYLIVSPVQQENANAGRWGKGNIWESRNWSPESKTDIRIGKKLVFQMMFVRLCEEGPWSRHGRQALFLSLESLLHDPLDGRKILFKLGGAQGTRT